MVSHVTWHMDLVVVSPYVRLYSRCVKTLTFHFPLQRLVTLGHETINTPLYMQLDADHCHLVTDSLNRYALIGESVGGGRAVKILRLAAFAPAITPSLDYSIRVYVVEDTQDALEVCAAFSIHD